MEENMLATRSNGVDMSNFSNGVDNLLCKKLKNGMCRLSIDGKIAIKTSSGYKTYDVEKERLVNCSNFTFNGMDEMFFVMPTMKVKVGDIIISNGKPVCVIEKSKKRIEVLSYQDNSINIIIPERQMFMGNVYFFAKIVSLFGNFTKGGKKGGQNKVMKMLMISEMMKSMGNGFSPLNPTGGNGESNMLSMLFMSNIIMGGGNSGGFFDDLFNGIFDDSDDEEAEALLLENDKEEE